MTLLSHFQTVWAGVTGAPYYSNFYFNLPSGVTTDQVSVAVQNFFEATKALRPVGSTVTFGGSGDTIEDTTGELQSTFAATPWTSTGTANGSIAPSVNQVLIRLNTNGVREGRRVRGKVYMGAMMQSAIGSSGGWSATPLTQIASAAEVLRQPITGQIAPNGWVVYSRPRRLEIGGPISPGRSFAVNSVTVPPLVAVLRSRRS